jgi:hypothetical protein
MEAHNIKFDDDRTLPPYNQTFSLFFLFYFLLQQRRVYIPATPPPCGKRKKENVFKARPARVQTKRSHTSIETKNAQRQAKSIHAFLSSQEN